MRTWLIAAFLGVVGSITGVGVVAHLVQMGEPRTCFSALALIPGLLFGLPVGLIVGVGAGIGISNLTKANP